MLMCPGTVLRAFFTQASSPGKGPLCKDKETRLEEVGGLPEVTQLMGPG